MIFSRRQLWVDPVRRAGPEAMAVDEWLLETAELPVLRVYEWAGEWASIGYFDRIAGARAAFPDIDLVRRWTGGGMVDHRADWTYTVVVPRTEPLANWRGAESYRTLHAALADVLAGEGISARMSLGEEQTGAALCFENPVGHDLLGPDGGKLAGAGQRRSRQGLLHQGSVAGRCRGALSERRAGNLAGRLAGTWNPVSLDPVGEDLSRRCLARYACGAWTVRR